MLHQRGRLDQLPVRDVSGRIVGERAPGFRQPHDRGAVDHCRARFDQGGEKAGLELEPGDFPTKAPGALPPAGSRGSPSSRPCRAPARSCRPHPSGRRGRLRRRAGFPPPSRAGGRRRGGSRTRPDAVSRLVGMHGEKRRAPRPKGRRPFGLRPPRHRRGLELPACRPGKGPRLLLPPHPRRRRGRRKRRRRRARRTDERGGAESPAFPELDQIAFDGRAGGRARRIAPQRTRRKMDPAPGRDRLGIRLPGIEEMGASLNLQRVIGAVHEPGEDLNIAAFGPSRVVRLHHDLVGGMATSVMFTAFSGMCVIDPRICDTRIGPSSGAACLTARKSHCGFGSTRAGCWHAATASHGESRRKNAQPGGADRAHDLKNRPAPLSRITGLRPRPSDRAGLVAAVMRRPGVRSDTLELHHRMGGGVGQDGRHRRPPSPAGCPTGAYRRPFQWHSMQRSRTAQGGR